MAVDASTKDMTLKPDEAPGPLRVVAAVPDTDGYDRQLLRVIAGGSAGPSPALRRRAARYRRFLDALGVALYTTDPDGRITFFNRAATEFWGRTPGLGELWCGSLRMFTTEGAPLPHNSCPMAIALKNGEPMHGAEAVAERPDGSRVTFLAYPTPLRDDDGQRVVGGVNVLVDITERRQAEDALRATASALVRSNAVKDEFLGLVSHELRTPVTTILGNARLLRNRAGSMDPETVQGMLQDIDDEAGRLHTVIENLLALTRLGAGAEVEREPQLVDRVIARAVDEFGRRYPERVVETRIRDRFLIVDADESLLRLVLANFLGNAHKYSEPEQPIEVEVAQAPGGIDVEVSVLDRGIGLGDATPAELFEPFYRAPEAKKRAAGIGIGLAVCRRVVESFGGRAWAAPREGGGSVFTVAIPVSAVGED